MSHTLGIQVDEAIYITNCASYGMVVSSIAMSSQNGQQRENNNFIPSFTYLFPYRERSFEWRHPTYIVPLVSQCLFGPLVL